MIPPPSVQEWLGSEPIQDALHRAFGEAMMDMTITGSIQPAGNYFQKALGDIDWAAFEKRTRAKREMVAGLAKSAPPPWRPLEVD